MDCPTYEQLALNAFTDGGQHPGQEHVSACPHCTGRMDLLTRMQQALAAGDLPAAPDGLRRAAEGLARPEPAMRGAQRPGWLSGLKILVAELLPGPQLIPAVRRATAPEKRSLYQAGDYEIDILVTPQRKLLGQVIPIDNSELPEARCTLVGDRVQHASLSPTGEFQFDDAGHGPASLTFEWDDTRVLLPEVDLAG